VTRFFLLSYCSLNASSSIESLDAVNAAFCNIDALLF
jgi:hypothetical protein